MTLILVISVAVLFLSIVAREALAVRAARRRRRVRERLRRRHELAMPSEYQLAAEEAEARLWQETVLDEFEAEQRRERLADELAWEEERRALWR